MARSPLLCLSNAPLTVSSPLPVVAQLVCAMAGESDYDLDIHRGLLRALWLSVAARAEQCALRAARLISARESKRPQPADLDSVERAVRVRELGGLSL